MRFAPARRRGYAKRYLRHQLGQHGMELLLAAAFLLGVLLGCWMTSGENTRLVEQLNGLLSAQQGSFLMQVVGSFAAVAALLLNSLFERLGCCFSAIGAVGAVLARDGIWRAGCLLLCRRTTIQYPLLPAGASSTGVGGGSVADLCGRMCAAFFQPLFLRTLPKRRL